ncbi:serpin-ZX [Tanacetum coccineum]
MSTRGHGHEDVKQNHQSCYLQLSTRQCQSWKAGFKNGNFVCSPFSIEIVLGMLAFGAEGQTLKQLLEFLGHKSLEELRSMSLVSKILEHILLSTIKGGPDVRIANEVWVAEQLKPVQSCYREVLETVYKTKADYIDNENKPAQSAETINSWTKEKTNGLIPKLIGEFTPDDALVIANSLYFKGIWSKPFALEYTKEKDFHLINGEKVPVPFMTRFGEFDYGSFESYKMVRFPYESGFKGYNMFKRPCESEFNGFNMFNRPYESEFNGFNMFKQPYECNGQSNEFSMYIFLPDRIDGLQDLLQLFQSDPSLFYRDFNLQRRRPDELWIPKFEMSCTFNAHDRSVIKVDEKGTEAAAVTTVMVATCSCSCPPPPASVFVSRDHPVHVYDKRKHFWNCFLQRCGGQSWSVNGPPPLWLPRKDNWIFPYHIKFPALHFSLCSFDLSSLLRWFSEVFHELLIIFRECGWRH